MARPVITWLVVLVATAQVCAQEYTSKIPPRATEVFKNWELARAKLRKNLNVEIETVSTRVFWPETRSETEQLHFQIKTSDAGFLAIFQSLKDEKGDHGGLVQGRNEDYVFELRRSGSTPQWYVRNLETMSPETEQHVAVRTLADITNNFQWFPWDMNGSELVMQKMISGEFQVESVILDANGGTFATLFARRNDLATENGEQVPVQRSVRMTLDPENYYLPIRIEDDFVKYQSVILFEDFRDFAGVGVPFASSINWTPSGSSKTRQIKSLSLDSIPNKEFRLPAFGIVEPNFVKRKSLWLLYSAAILVGVLFIGGLVFRRWQHNQMA